jgi:hypothetical protein
MKREIINFPLAEIEPVRTPVFQSQGITPGDKPSHVVYELYEDGVELFLKLAEPAAIISEISIREFAAIYTGEDKNGKNTPLEHIFPRATNLALFVGTLGEKISREISRLLDGCDFALGFMLDSVASFCADKVSKMSEQYFLKTLLKRGQADNSTRVLNYSPGYCGWDISGQGKLFASLHSEEIWIRLNESYLMTPLKSVSGVLVAGDRKIHYFKNNYPFCKECKTRTCRYRIRSLEAWIPVRED